MSFSAPADHTKVGAINRCGNSRRTHLLRSALSLSVIGGRAAQKFEDGYGDICLRLALKAQSQSRATLETLSVVKNPPSVAFVRQANIAHGPQQVNTPRNR